MMQQSRGMEFFLNCLSELTIEFEKYCKQRGVQFRDSSYSLIRRNIRVNPISKLLKVYNEVKSLPTNEQVAPYCDYIENEIANYLLLGKGKSLASQAVHKSVQTQFFEMIIRKSEVWTGSACK